jgi:hypothetical protein
VVAVAVAVEAVAADARPALDAAAGAPAPGVAADVPAAGAAAPVAAADRASALSPAAAAGAAVAFAACVDRRLFAGPRAGGPVPAAAQHAGAPGPVACACSGVLVDVAARAADCRSLADSTAEPMEADRCSAAD